VSSAARLEDDETGSDLGRVLALSDGVFAIALTVLVLEIALPATTTTATLGRDLRALGPKFFAYALSFFTIGTMWLIHRLAFRRIARTNATLLIVNLLLLMGVAFIPFPTAVLGEFGGNVTATVFYAVTMTGVSCLSSGLWWYASGDRGLLRPGTDLAWVRAGRMRALVGPIVFVASIPVAVVAPYAAVAMWLLTFPLRLLVPRLLGANGIDID
jgi:TMEM175 potassium channel family protein